MPGDNPLKEVADLVEEGRVIDALAPLDEYMFKNPDDPRGHFMLGHIMMESEKPAIAKLAFQSVTNKDPKRHQGWNNLGKAYDDLLLFKDAERCFKRAYKLDPNLTAKENLSTNAVHQCNPDRAIHWAKEALKENPDSIAAHLNLGFSYLMKRNYDLGWPEYEWGLGKTRWRDVRNYTGEPVWDGTKGKHVVVYGEQGIGDQIAFAGVIQEARRDCKNLILDVNPKLENLFYRSFILETHGDMFKTDISWPNNRINKIDYSCSLSQIQKFYRTQRRGAYLVPDPIRKRQWQRTFEDMGRKPKIGIAWTGGMKETNDTGRSTTLESLFPILTKEADFINLEYKDRSAEIEKFHMEHGIKIHDFPWATQSKDYDDTAALVSELDLVISVPTSVVHLAGALGKACYCMVHPNPHFMFGLEGKEMPFYKSVELFRRNGSWDKPIKEIEGKLYGM